MIIGQLSGTIIGIGQDTLLIEVGGVGYVAQAGIRLLSSLNIGTSHTLAIETRVSEASIQLYAFAEESERAWFVRLQDVHGVAGKAALAILDALPPSELAQCLALGDATSLTRAKGVGKKLADRLITELGGKPPPTGWMQSYTPNTTTPLPSVKNATSGHNHTTDANTRPSVVSALENLGYSTSEAVRAVAEAQTEAGAELSIEAWIKHALKRISAHG